MQCRTTNRFNPTPASWTLLGGLVRPKTRCGVRLTGPNADDPIQIEANTLSHPDDLTAALGRPFLASDKPPGNAHGTLRT